MGSLALLETAEGMDKELLAILCAIVSYNSKLETKYQELILVAGVKLR